MPTFSLKSRFVFEVTLVNIKMGILAKALNCVKGTTPQPCGKCDSCLAVAAGNDLDVIEIDGASNRGIDEVRDLREKVKLAPSRGRYKVYIIDEVHMLTTPAFNALLKTLEEPPPNVVFVFATTEAHKVIPTIVSRCQHFHFRRLPVELITGRLSQIAEEEKFSVDDEILSFIARQAEGCLRDAQGILEQAVAASGKKVTQAYVEEILDLSDHNRVLSLLTAVVEGKSGPALDIVRQLYSEGANLNHLLESLIAMANDLLLISADAFDEAYTTLSPDEITQLTDIAEGKELADIFAMVNTLIRAKGDYLRAVDPLTALELAVLRAGRMIMGVPVLEMLTALETENTATAGQNTATAGQNTATAGQNTATAGQNTATAGQTPPQRGRPRYGGAKSSGDIVVPSPAGEDERWSSVLAYLKKEDARTEALLKDARLVELSTDKLVLSYPESHSFHIEKVQEALVQESIKRACAQVLSAEPALEVQTHSKRETTHPKAKATKSKTSVPKTPTKDAEVPPKTSSEAKQEGEIFTKSDDPLVQKELERFRAQIVNRKKKDDGEGK